MAICSADYLPRFRPDHRKTDNAIVVRVDQRFQKSRAPVNGSVNDLSIA